MYDDLIEEYTSKVTKDMGASQRAEVGNELKSHIYDSAEALAASRSKPVDESIIREAIGRMMPPEKLAAMYPSKETFLQKNKAWDAIKSLAGIAFAFLLIAAILTIVAPGAVDIPVKLILTVASALAFATVIIAIIFFLIYLYESRLKATYEVRLQRLEKSLDYPASPLKISIMIVMSLFWMALLVLFWPRVPFISNFTTGEMVPLLTADFGQFVPAFLAIGALTIIAQVLYLVLPQKWIPSLLEAVLSVCSVLMSFWLLTVFPFNPALASVVLIGVKVFLAIGILGGLIDAAKKLWQTAKFFIYGDITSCKA